QDRDLHRRDRPPRVRSAPGRLRFVGDAPAELVPPLRRSAYLAGMSTIVLPEPVLPAASVERTTMLCSPGPGCFRVRSYVSTGESLRPSAGWTWIQSPASTAYAVSR